MIEVGAQLRKGVVEYCVLGLLAAEPMYGWQISQTLLSHQLIASIGTLYPLLTRLRSRGLVSTYSQASQAGPSRRYYELTAEGRNELKTFRSQWSPFAEAVNEIVREDQPSD